MEEENINRGCPKRSHESRQAKPWRCQPHACSRVYDLPANRIFPRFIAQHGVERKRKRKGKRERTGLLIYSRSRKQAVSLPRRFSLGAMTIRVSSTRARPSSIPTAPQEPHENRSRTAGEIRDRPLSRENHRDAAYQS